MSNWQVGRRTLFLSLLLLVCQPPYRCIGHVESWQNHSFGRHVREGVSTGDPIVEK